MKNLQPVLLAAAALVVVVAGVSVLSSKISYAPSQTTTALQEENLDSDLNALDATDLDTGTNSQLDQLSSDSSSF